MAIKVLFLIQGFEVASSRYRVLQYIPYLEKKDILATVVPFPKTILDKINIYPKISKFDILFLHRKRLPFFEHLYVRRKAKKIIYDFDDAVMVRNSTRENPYSITRFRRFVRTVKDSDYIFAGNRFLMEQAKKYNPNVMVLPTSIDLNNYPLKNWKIRSDNIIIGWIGDTGSLHYLEKRLSNGVKKTPMKKEIFEIMPLLNSWLFYQIWKALMHRMQVRNHQIKNSFDLKNQRLSKISELNRN